MVHTLKTYAEVVNANKNATFKQFYTWAKKNGRIVTDIADYNPKDILEVGVEFSYKGVRFGVMCDFSSSCIGKYFINYFYKEAKHNDDDYHFGHFDVYEVDGYEVDWWDFFGTPHYVLNNHSKEFENCSGIKKFIYLSSSAREYMSIYESKCDENADYIVYDKLHEKVGYIIVIEDQE
jgi:hypothetical protein